MVDKKTSVIAVLCVTTILFLGLWVNAGQEAQRLGGIEDEYEKLSRVRTNIEENYSKLRTEKEDLEAEHSVLIEENTALKENLNRAARTYTDLLQETVAINKEKEELENSISELVKTINATEVMNWTQTIQYNISAGTERTWEFLIPKYGIIWEAKISFSGSYVTMSHSWRRGDERVFVGSSGISLTEKDYADLVYYGIQEHLWGTITVDYYLDERDPNKLWVTGSIKTNLPTISRSAHAYIDI